ncbi:MAG: chemotaxis protein CheW [Deltaproteobacteria bacterium]
MVPIIRLNLVFNVDASLEDPCEAILVVVEYEGRLRALMVDEVLGKQEVVIKSLGGLLTDIKGVAGGTILGRAFTWRLFRTGAAGESIQIRQRKVLKEEEVPNGGSD